MYWNIEGMHSAITHKQTKQKHAFSFFFCCVSSLMEEGRRVGKRGEGRNTPEEIRQWCTLLQLPAIYTLPPIPSSLSLLLFSSLLFHSLTTLSAIPTGLYRMVRISVLNDCLRNIVNAERKGKRQVLIRPSSKVVIKVCDSLFVWGFRLCEYSLFFFSSFFSFSFFPPPTVLASDDEAWLHWRVRDCG